VKRSRILSLLMTTVASLLLLLTSNTPQAFAASSSRDGSSLAKVQQGNHTVAVPDASRSTSVRLASGGGCLSWVINPPNFTDTVCDSEDSSHYIVADIYLSTPFPNSFTSFTIQEDVKDRTTGSWMRGIHRSLVIPTGHYLGPIFPAVAGHQYIAYTSWIAVANGKVYSREFDIDFSPIQIA